MGSDRLVRARMHPRNWCSAIGIVVAELPSSSAQSRIGHTESGRHELPPGGNGLARRCPGL